MSVPTWRYEDAAILEGCRVVAGVDEVGRGSLAGPVVAAAVVLDRRRPVRGVNDSKLLTPARRRDLARRIVERSMAVGLGVAPSEEVDRLNVLQATLAAMRRAIEALGVRPDCLLLDAVRLREVDARQVSLVHGDRLSMSIAAASIVAKVVRDDAMEHYAEAFPAFDFAANKGYGTRGHLEALERLGPCPIHRRTFHGVWIERPLAFEG